MRLVLVSICCAFLLTAAVLSSAGAIAAPSPEAEGETRPRVVGTEDSYEIMEDTVLTVTAPGVLGNDVEPEDGKLRVITRTGETENGFIYLTEDGGFVYTPTLNYHGPDFFTYTLYDTAQPTQTADVTVSLTVSPVNDAPIAFPLTKTVKEATPLEITLLAEDVDEDPLTYEIRTDPTSGTFTKPLVEDKITYKPNCGFTGTDSFTFIARDDEGSESNEATVTIIVEPQNYPPVIKKKADGAVVASLTLTTAEDTQIVLPELVVDDRNCDPMTFSRTEGPNFGSLFGSFPGVLTYMPSKDLNGVDHFHLNASDGEITSSVPVTITITPVNDPPTSVHFSGKRQLAENQPPDTIVGSFSTKDPDDPDSTDTYTYTLVTGSTSFRIRGDTLYTNRSFDYESAGAGGTLPPQYPITVRATDPAGASITTTLTIEITNVNEPPEGLADVYGFDFGMTLVVTETGLLNNDWDIDTPHENLTAVLVEKSGPQHGTLDLNPNGTFTYTASSIDFTGVVSFTYRVYDGELYSTPIPVEIAVHQSIPVWTLPTKTGQIYTAQDNIVTLHVEFPETPEQIAWVRYSRWDAKYELHREIGVTEENPFTFELDTRQLNPGWNQIIAHGFNDQDLPTAQSWIWIKMPDRRLFLPYVSGPP